jgi:hypothetical protein
MEWRSGRLLVGVTRGGSEQMDSVGFGSAARMWCLVGMSTRVITRTKGDTSEAGKLLRRKTSDWRRKRRIRRREGRTGSN